ncbi:MAG: RNA methyltransferase, partial [Prevotella sp.]|nr:RNA methyltransferase [Prevotella sp.]
KNREFKKRLEEEEENEEGDIRTFTFHRHDIDSFMKKDREGRNMRRNREDREGKGYRRNGKESKGKGFGKSFRKDDDRQGKGRRDSGNKHKRFSNNNE